MLISFGFEIVCLPLLVGLLPWIVGGDLVVNVRNQGGESYKQTIRANLTDETVRLHFESYDGSSTTMVIDFRNEMQLVHTIRLGDQEENEIFEDPGIISDSGGMKQRKQSKKSGRLFLDKSRSSPAVYKSYCFVTKFKAQEFIPVDAMAKLRQKNPWSLRVPERNEPAQNISFDILLDATASDWISPAIRSECLSQDSLFVTNTYAIKMEISERAVNPEDYLRAVRDIVVEEEEEEESGKKKGRRDCFGEGVRSGSACVCNASVCIGWYPCSLKFCRARSSGSNSTSLGGGGSSNGNNNGAGSSTVAGVEGGNFKTYRCGIHTCRICRNYVFGVTSRFECV